MKEKQNIMKVKCDETEWRLLSWKIIRVSRVFLIGVSKRDRNSFDVASMNLSRLLWLSFKFIGLSASATVAKEKSADGEQRRLQKTVKLHEAQHKMFFFDKNKEREIFLYSH